MEKSVILELKNVSKSFGGKRANKDVNLSLNEGEVLAILGENGSGKTTLMNMIAGIYYPDSGKILIRGQEVSIASPQDAFRYNIGMIHQHFKLVDVFSAAENIVLGIKGEKYNLKKATTRIEEIVHQYGFEIDLNKKIYEMSVSEKQTVEIIKVLYRGADILILDEPTAVLTPQEIDKLFAVLKNMRAHGKSIIIITHKLNEVMEISDRVAILRKGEYVGTVNTAETDEDQLTELMVGEKIELNIDRPLPVDPQKRLEIKNLTLLNDDGVRVLDDVSFSVFGGEILGVAGIAGSGQRELLETISGLYTPAEGSEINYFKPNADGTESLIGKTPVEIRDLGVRLSFVPEDRLGMGLVANMDIVDNMMLRSYRKRHGMFVDRKEPGDLAEEIIKRLKVVTPGSHTAVRKLSGGNIQKILVGREISSSPTVLMAAYPVRGLDINSSYTIYDLLNKQKEMGVAVIFVGEDLDVLLELCDRIVVIAGGKITGIEDGRNTDKRKVGYLMTQTEKYVEKECE